MYHLYVLPIRNTFTYHLYLSPLCITYVSLACITCMYYLCVYQLYVLPVYITCVSHLCVRGSRYPLFIVAPEGTTKHKHCLLTFAKGAFAPGLPVMPVLLKYSSVRFNPGWGIVYTAWHFFRVFNQFKNNLEVEVLPIYYPSPGVEHM